MSNTRVTSFRGTPIKDMTDEQLDRVSAYIDAYYADSSTSMSRLLQWPTIWDAQCEVQACRASREHARLRRLMLRI